MDQHGQVSRGRFPLGGSILLGLGLGGFFDGIVLHQILQWHHMASSAGHSPETLEGLKFNTLLDGLFHAATYLSVLFGLALLWRAARKPHPPWPAGLLAGTLLMGFGSFNIVEGVLNHFVLGLHHVNETVPREYWLVWDVGFLAWGAAMLLGGWRLYARAKRSADPNAEAAPGA